MKLHDFKVIPMKRAVVDVVPPFAEHILIDSKRNSSTAMVQYVI